MRAWTVLGFFSMKSCLTYMTAAGFEPPKSARVPSSVRLSAMILMSPSCSSLVIMGSRLESASISPFLMAATADGPMPTPI